MLSSLKLPAGIVLAVALTLLVAGCGSSKSDTSSTATTADAADCTPAKLPTQSKGTLTVATDKPAYPPYFENDEPSQRRRLRERRRLRDRQAARLLDRRRSSGRSSRSTPPTRPGPRTSTSTSTRSRSRRPREKAVDFSSPYYTANQAVVALKGSDAAKAKSLDELKDAKIGVQIGTTSLDAVEERDRPEQQAGSLQQLQRRRHGAQERTDRRRRRRPADGALPDRGPGPGGDRRRPVQRPRRRRMGRAAGERTRR